jgi:hypothetical protein
MKTQQEQMELIQALAEICKELGWIVGVPTTPDSTTAVPGLIIGTEEFVYQVVANYYGPDVNDHVEAYTTAEADATIEETVLPDPNKKKTTLH